MFSTTEKLIQRTGRNKIGRFEFLKQLVTEFKESNSADAKQQVMANLANFAYDPINYEFLRELGVIDLFLDQLAEDDSILAKFAVGGLCNLALDNQNKEYISANGGINQISTCLISNNEDMVLSAITALMFLVSPQNKHEITSGVIVGQMLELSRNTNCRISNLAKIFLEDYCSEGQVANIPLPADNTRSITPSQHHCA